MNQRNRNNKSYGNADNNGDQNSVKADNNKAQAAGTACNKGTKMSTCGGGGQAKQSQNNKSGKMGKMHILRAAVLLMTQFRKPSIARHPGSRLRLSVTGMSSSHYHAPLTLSPSAPMSLPCPRSPPAPPPSQTAGVSGNRTGTARITASAASTDAPTHVSGPPSLHQNRSLIRILRPPSLRSRHSHRQATRPASAVVSCFHPPRLDTASLTVTKLTSLPRLLRPPPPLSPRVRPGLLSLPHPGQQHLQHQRLRHRAPQVDHDLQMSRNRNRFLTGLIYLKSRAFFK